MKKLFIFFVGFLIFSESAYPEFCDIPLAVLGKLNAPFLKFKLKLPGKAAKFEINKLPSGIPEGKLGLFFTGRTGSITAIRDGKIYSYRLKWRKVRVTEKKELKWYQFSYWAGKQKELVRIIQRRDKWGWKEAVSTRLRYPVTGLVPGVLIDKDADPVLTSDFDRADQAYERSQKDSTSPRLETHEFEGAGKNLSGQIDRWKISSAQLYRKSGVYGRVVATVLATVPLFYPVDARLSVGMNERTGQPSAAIPFVVSTYWENRKIDEYNKLLNFERGLIFDILDGAQKKEPKRVYEIYDAAAVTSYTFPAGRFTSAELRQKLQELQDLEGFSHNVAKINEVFAELSKTKLVWKDEYESSDFHPQLRHRLYLPNKLLADLFPSQAEKWKNDDRVEVPVAIIEPLLKNLRDIHGEDFWKHLRKTLMTSEDWKAYFLTQGAVDLFSKQEIVEYSKKTDPTMNAFFTRSSESWILDEIAWKDHLRALIKPDPKLQDLIEQSAFVRLYRFALVQRFLSKAFLGDVVDTEAYQLAYEVFAATLRGSLMEDSLRSSYIRTIFTWAVNRREPYKFVKKIFEQKDGEAFVEYQILADPIGRQFMNLPADWTGQEQYNFLREAVSYLLTTIELPPADFDREVKRYHSKIVELIQNPDTGAGIRWDLERLRKDLEKDMKKK